MRRLEITPPTVAALCVIYYVNPLDVFWRFLAAVVLHEAAHVLALLACGVRPQKLCFGLNGAQLYTRVPGRRQEALCALAGPAANLLLAALLLRVDAVFVLLNLLLAAFNLLPVEPLDGGRALRAAMGPGRRCRLIQFVLLAALCLCALGLTAAGWGLGPVAAAGLLLARAGLELAVAKREENR